MLRFFLAATLATWSSAAFGQDCTGPGFAGAMAQIEAYYESQPIDLFNTQLQVNAVAARQVLAADGQWGPATALEVCGRLQTYAAINGAPPDDYIRNPANARAFVVWIGSMARFALNPGSYEAPD